jgi:hypothetical protein
MSSTGPLICTPPDRSPVQVVTVLLLLLLHCASDGAGSANTAPPSRAATTKWRKYKQRLMQDGVDMTSGLLIKAGLVIAQRQSYSLVALPLARLQPRQDNHRRIPLRQAGNRVKKVQITARPSRSTPD